MNDGLSMFKVQRFRGIARETGLRALCGKGHFTAKEAHRQQVRGFCGETQTESRDISEYCLQLPEKSDAQRTGCVSRFARIRHILFAAEYGARIFY